MPYCSVPLDFPAQLFLSSSITPNDKCTGFLRLAEFTANHTSEIGNKTNKDEDTYLPNGPLYVCDQMFLCSKGSSGLHLFSCHIANSILSFSKVFIFVLK